MTNIARIASATLAGVLLSGAVASADSPHALVTDIPGNSFSYQVDFNGSFWNGQRISFSRTATVSVRPDRTVHVVNSGKAPNDGSELDGTIGSDGLIAAQNAGNRLESFNTVAGLLGKAPSALGPGTTWTAVIPIQTSGTSQFSYLPVTIKVASSDANGTVLQGTGAQSIVSSYDGYSVPIDVSARFALRLGTNGFDRCDFAADELVHAGSQVQNMQWTWSMTRLADRS